MQIRACMAGGHGLPEKLPLVTQLSLKARLPSLLTVEQAMQEPPVHLSSWLYTILDASNDVRMNVLITMDLVTTVRQTSGVDRQRRFSIEPALYCRGKESVVSGVIDERLVSMPALPGSPSRSATSSPVMASPATQLLAACHARWRRCVCAAPVCGAPQVSATSHGDSRAIMRPTSAVATHSEQLSGRRQGHSRPVSSCAALQDVPLPSWIRCPVDRKFA